MAKKTIVYETTCLEDFYPRFNETFASKLKGRTLVEGNVLKISGGTSFRFNCNNIFGSISASIKDGKQYIIFSLASAQLMGARFDALAKFLMEEACQGKNINYYVSNVIPSNATPTLEYLSKGNKKTESGDVVSQLMDLKKLLDSGLITQEEFEKMKAKIIG